MPLLGAAAAVARARRFTTYPSGKCLSYVSNVLTNGKMLGAFGVASAPYALHAWNHAKWRHTTANPPAGVPVFFSHSASNSYGHVAISVGGGRIRTTSWPGTHVGETSISNLCRAWNRKYLGWSEDLYGVRISGFPRPVVWVPYPYPGPSRQGDSGARVKVIQTRLNQLGYRLSIDSSFGPKTKAAVKAFQKVQKITQDGVVGPTTWARLKIQRRA